MKKWLTIALLVLAAPAMGAWEGDGSSAVIISDVRDLYEYQTFSISAWVYVNGDGDGTFPNIFGNMDATANSAFDSHVQLV